MASSPIVAASVSQTDRSAAIVKHDALKHAPIDIIETEFVYFQCAQLDVCTLFVNGTRTANLRKIAHTAQQTIGNTRCAAAAPGDFVCAFVLAGDVQNACRTFNDTAKAPRANTARDGA